MRRSGDTWSWLETALWSLALACLLSSASARSIYAELEESMAKRRDPDCPVQQNEAMLAVFDRICDMCHDMFHHEMPDLRTQCRLNCFRNEHFKLCLSQYSPGAGGGLSLPPVRRSSYYVF